VRVSLQVEMRRAGFSATTGKGIKNTSSPPLTAVVETVLLSRATP